ncbi:hypothetical protein GQR36_16785 [Enterococcus termitis]
MKNDYLSNLLGLLVVFGLWGQALKKFLPELTHITIPVLLIVGELDTKFQQIADQMKQRQVTFSIKTVSDAGHCVHLEKPQQFEKIVYDFLKGGSNSDN